MATINVFHEEDGRNYTVTANLVRSIIDRLPGGSVSDLEVDDFIQITTTMTKVDGSFFGTWIVRKLTDVPPGYSTAVNFSQLISYYVDYFLTVSTFGQSSSSSTSSFSSSSSSTSQSSSSSTSSSSSSSSSSSTSSASSSSSDSTFSSESESSSSSSSSSIDSSSSSSSTSS